MPKVSVKFNVTRRKHPETIAMDSAKVGASVATTHNNDVASSFVPLQPPKSIPLSAKLNKGAKDAAVEATEYAAKYRIYERDYLRRINHKYFYGKNLAGTGRVFDTVTTVDGFVVKESREPPITRFLETPNSQEEQLSKSAIAPAAKRHMTRKST